MELLTVTEAAKRLGLNKGTVSRQVRKLGLARDDGKVDMAAYEAARAEGLNPLMARNGEGAGASAGDHAPANAVRQNRGFMGASTAHKALQAKQLEINIRRDLGELVDQADVIRDEQTVWAELTAALLALPARLAPELARMDDAAAVRHRLDREIKAAFADASAKLKALPPVPDDFGDAQAA